MALNVRYVAITGSAYAFSVERLADGLNYDFADGTFSAEPVTLHASLTESELRQGVYEGTIASTPVDPWVDGEYVVYIHVDAGEYPAQDAVVALMKDGSDAHVFPAASGVDYLGVNLTSYNTANTLGFLAKRLDEEISAEKTLTSDQVDAIVEAKQAAIVEGTITEVQALRLLLARLAGTNDLVDGDTREFRALTDSGKTRLTVDFADGEHPSVTVGDLT